MLFLPSASIWRHCSTRRLRSRVDLLLGDVLGRGADDHAVAVELHLVEDPPQALALVVGQALGDAVGRGAGDEHDEAPGQRDLLGQPCALGPDRVLGDLADDRLPVLQDLLDPGLALLLDVLGVVLDVTPVEHRVLGRGDVDERRLHAGQDVLDPTDVDVPVDLADVVGRVRHLVLDQGPALQHGDLGHAVGDTDRHRVAADGPALAPAPAASLHRLLVELDGVLVVGQERLDRGHGLAAPTSLVAVASALVAVAASLAAAAAATTPAATSAPPAPATAGRAPAAALAAAALAAAVAVLVALRGGRGGAGVADLGLADDRLLGRLLGRPVLGDAIR